MKKETWKNIDIENLCGRYQVSNLGNVKRTAICKVGWGGEYTIEQERLITPFDNGNGYKVVGFTIREREKKKRKNFYVHRLVATAFIDNPQNKPEVNHKNYNRGDNRAENLEWCTDIENTNYSKEHMRHPIKKISGIRYKGGKYEVEITHGGKAYYCGRYWEFEDAVKARTNKLKELGVDEKYY